MVGTRLKVATPLDVVAVAVVVDPLVKWPPELIVIVTVLLLSVVTVLPFESSTRTVTAVVIVVPEIVLLGCTPKTSLFAAPAFTVSSCVAEVMVLGDVLAAVIVGVPAAVSVYVKLALLAPVAIDSGLAGVNVTVPPELLDSVTVLVASVVFALPY